MQQDFQPVENFGSLCIKGLKKTLPAGIYLLRVNNRNARTRCEICSKFTPCSSVSIVNFEHVILWELFSETVNDYSFHKKLPRRSSKYISHLNLMSSKRTSINIYGQCINKSINVDITYRHTFRN